MCVENKDLHSTRKMYSVVSMTLLYLTPILAVSVSHLLISRKLKNRMVNRKFKDKNSQSSSKFLSKPKSGIKPADSGVRPLSSSRDHRSTSSFALTTVASGAVEARTSFGRGAVKNEPQTNIGIDGPFDPGVNWNADSRFDDQRVNCGQEKIPADITLEAAINPADNKVEFSRFESSAAIGDDVDVIGSQANSGRRTTDSLVEVEVAETSTNNSTPSSPLPESSSRVCGFLASFKDRKKSDASAAGRQEKRIPKFKPSLRREQRLQSHRQQLAQLGSQLQQLNQLQRQQQLTSPTRQQLQQLHSTQSVQIPVIVETLVENSAHDSQPNLFCRSEFCSAEDDSDRIENVKVTPRKSSRKGQRSTSSFSMSSLKNKLRRRSKRISKTSESGGNLPGATGGTNGRVTAEELTPLERQRKSREEASKRKRKTNRLLLTIALVFAISWLPMNLFNLLSDFQSDFIHSLNRRSKQLLAPTCLVMVLVSTCVNPLLYGWLNENFRQEFQLVLCCCKAVTDRGRTKGSVKGRPGQASSCFKALPGSQRIRQPDFG